MKRLETRVRELERGIIDSEFIPPEVVILNGTEEENEKKLKEAEQRIEQRNKENPEIKEYFLRSGEPQMIVVKIVRGSEDLQEED